MSTPRLLQRIMSSTVGSFGRCRTCRRHFANSGFLQVSSLEARMLPSSTGAVFDSAIAIGGEVDGTNTTCLSVTTDSAGNRYVTGGFFGTVDFDPMASHAGDIDILTARGSDDGYVAKYAADNSLVWIVQFGGESLGGSAVTEVGKQIEVTGTGTVLVAGEFIGSTTLGSTSLTSAGGKDAFVLSLSNAGTVQWVRSWGTSDADLVLGLDTDSAGNVHVLSERWEDSMEIRKFTPSGSQTWSKSIANSAERRDGGLVVDPIGNVYIAGSFEGNVDFDPGPKTKAISSGTAMLGSSFVLSLSPNGALQWVSPFIAQSSGDVALQSLAWDPNGYVVAAGYYNGLVDMQPSKATQYLSNTPGTFVTKLKASTGALEWSKGFERTDIASVSGLEIDGAGNIYAAGVFNASLTLSPGSPNSTVTSLGGPDCYIVKLNSTGAVQWFETYGGAGYDLMFDIDLGSNGAIYMAGQVWADSDLDPDATSTYELTATQTRKKGYLLKLLEA